MTADEEPEPESELGALERPRRGERWLTLGVMCLTALLCALGAWSLRGEALYAVRERKPINLGELRTAALDARVSNRFVRAQATLERAPTVRYHRLGDVDGTDPNGSRWAVALALLLAACAAWNVAGVVRLTRRLPAQ